MRPAESYRGARRNNYVAVRANVTRFDGWSAWRAVARKGFGFTPEISERKRTRLIKREVKAQVYRMVALSGGGKREQARRVR